MCVYILSLATHPSQPKRFDLLQLDIPGVHLILMFLGTEQIKDVGAKALQLVGVSSGSRSAWGQ